MSVSKRTRYEVLRRDNHTCRYCGGTAPDVTLTIDHVVPVSLGGQDVPENLVAACRDCNAGKSSSTTDAALVADVAEDALRWRRAMQAAQEIVEREESARDALRAEFFEKWSSFTYTATGEKVGLPADWARHVGELAAGGITVRELRDSIDVAMAAKCRDEFYYFLGVARNKLGQRQILAQELLRRGMVDL